MAEIDVLKAQIVRDSPSVPWGFRLQGGADFGQPLTILRITPGSPAARIGLKSGDEVTEIGDVVTTHLSHDQASAVIAQYGQSLILTVERRARGSIPTQPIMNPAPAPGQQHRGYDMYDLTGNPNQAPHHTQHHTPRHLAGLQLKTGQLPLFMPTDVPPHIREALTSSQGAPPSHAPPQHHAYSHHAPPPGHAPSYPSPPAGHAPSYPPPPAGHAPPPGHASSGHAPPPPAPATLRPGPPALSSGGAVAPDGQYGAVSSSGGFVPPAAQAAPPRQPPPDYESYAPVSSEMPSRGPPLSAGPPPPPQGGPPPGSSMVDGGFRNPPRTGPTGGPPAPDGEYGPAAACGDSGGPPPRSAPEPSPMAPPPGGYMPQAQLGSPGGAFQPVDAGARNPSRKPAGGPPPPDGEYGPSSCVPSGPPPPPPPPPGPPQQQQPHPGEAGPPSSFRPIDAGYKNPAPAPKQSGAPPPPDGAYGPVSSGGMSGDGPPGDGPPIPAVCRPGPIPVTRREVGVFEPTAPRVVGVFQPVVPPPRAQAPLMAPPPPPGHAPYQPPSESYYQPAAPPPQSYQQQQEYQQASARPFEPPKLPRPGPPVQPEQEAPVYRPQPQPGPPPQQQQQQYSTYTDDMPENDNVLQSRTFKILQNLMENDDPSPVAKKEEAKAQQLYQKYADLLKEEDKGPVQSRTFNAITNMMEGEPEPAAGSAGLPPQRSAYRERQRQEAQVARPGGPQGPGAAQQAGSPRVKVFMPQQYNTPLSMYSAQNVVETFQGQAEMQLDQLEQKHPDVISGAQRAVFEADHTRSSSDF